MYIVNIAVRLLVLVFVFLGGAITFAGPRASLVRSVSAEAIESTDVLNSTSQEASTTERSGDKSPAQGIG